MTESQDHWTVGSGSYTINPAADTDDLLNDAAEWLECARALTDMMSERVQVSGISGALHRRRLIFTLQAIAMLTQMGTHCAVHAHAKMYSETK